MGMFHPYVETMLKNLDMAVINACRWLAGISSYSGMLRY